MTYWRAVDEFRSQRIERAIVTLQELGDEGTGKAVAQLCSLVVNDDEGVNWSRARLRTAVVLQIELAGGGWLESPLQRARAIDAAERFLNLRKSPGARLPPEYVLETSFRKRCWLWIAASHHGALDFLALWNDLRQLKALFPNDSDTHLAWGSAMEIVAWPKLGALGPVFIPDTDPEGARISWADKGTGSWAKAWLEVAEGEHRKALALDPASLEARLRLGRVLLDVARPKTAVEILAPLLESSRDVWVLYLAHLFTGRAYEALGRPVDAIGHYTVAVALRPDLQTPRTALSHALRSSGDHRAAVQAAREVHALNRPARDDPWWQYPYGPWRRMSDISSELRLEVCR
jgi:tetratricopeptide (TPR) repeat protein